MIPEIQVPKINVKVKIPMEPPYDGGVCYFAEVLCTEQEDDGSFTVTINERDLK